MQRPVNVILGFMLLLGTLPSVHAEEDEWKRLDAKAEALSNKGQFDQALLVENKALALAEKTRGPNHPDVATSLDGLGMIQTQQGHYAQAEASFQRELAIREKALGPKDPSVENALDRLGMLAYYQPQYSHPFFWAPFSVIGE